MIAVEIDSDNKELLAASINANMGKSVQFSNGCWISLKEEGGMFWGVSPYGLDWPCSTSGDAVSKIINWIVYWDKSRSETGELIEPEHFNLVRVIKG